MARWCTFVDVLDEFLVDRKESVQEVAARTATRRAWRGNNGTQPLYAFTSHFTRNRFWTHPGPYRPPAATQTDGVETSSATREHVRDTGARSTRETTARHSRERRTPRRLEPAEQTALQTLVSLGAALDVSFTARELRTAFRALAQRYHPDRHPSANDAERTRLGATFAELTSVYGVLSNTAR